MGASKESKAAISKEAKVESEASSNSGSSSSSLTSSNATIYKRLLKRAFPYWYAFLGAVFGYLIYGTTHPLSVKLIELIVDSIDKPRTDIHNWFPVAIVAIFAIRGLGTLLGSYGMAYVARKVVHELRIDMFSKLVRLPMAYYAMSSPGHLVSRITYNVEQVAAACSNAVTIMLREGIVVISLLGYLFYTNWKLTLIFLVVLPPVSLIVGVVSKRFRKLSKAIQNSMGDVTQVSSEVINAYQEVRVYGATDFEDKRFNKVSANNRKQSMKFALTDSVSAPVVQLLVAVALSIIVWLAMRPEVMGDVTPGEFIAFILAASLLDKPIRQLVKINGVIQKAIAAGQSIFDLLDEDAQEDTGTKTIENCKGNISFKNVSFSYGESQLFVIDDISFEAKAGETIALVGRSGGGKSSLVSLIPRFYEIDKGSVMLDGTDITELTLENLRSQIALVSQKVTLFNSSIYHNIAYGDLEQASEEQVKQAARMAYADKFIEALPEGYQTEVGQDGVQLSGGQRQRIAIARALLKNAPVIIMDEATSALDNESESMIQKALEGIRGDKTLIVIAHRLSTVENADKILVIDGGKLVEQGNHSELLAQNGFYARLYNSELAENNEESELLSSKKASEEE
jgi:subfamily B ATP-binding cassette protein MsbA